MANTVYHICAECADTIDNETEVVCEQCHYGFCASCCETNGICGECVDLEQQQNEQQSD